MTFKQFDKLCLLSGGKTCYFGPAPEASSYFATIGHGIPAEINPAEFYLDLINTDLDKNGEIHRRTKQVCDSWDNSEVKTTLVESMLKAQKEPSTTDLAQYKITKPNALMVPMTLLHRSWIKAYRDVIAYGIRFAMYLGLAILMGTVFLRFKSEQQYIQPYINAIFFGGAFMSFMAGKSYLTFSFLKRI